MDEGQRAIFEALRLQRYLPPDAQAAKFNQPLSTTRYLSRSDCERLLHYLA